VRAGRSLRSNSTTLRWKLFFHMSDLSSEATMAAASANGSCRSCKTVMIAWTGERTDPRTTEAPASAADS
jgi:hypothetical protein